MPHEILKNNDVINENRFIVKKKIANGSFGKIYEGVDTQDGNKDIICKVNSKLN